jgi:hypothetical protein
MLRLSLVLAFAWFLQSCSLGNLDVQSLLGSQPTSLPAPLVSINVIDTLANTATVTATRPTPSFTPTPTDIYHAPTPTVSGTPLPTQTIGLLAPTQVATLPAPPLELTSQSSAFDTIMLSGNKIFWGTCQPASIKIAAHVINAGVSSVLIFTRLQDLASNFGTNWSGGGAMNNDGKGSFTYVLAPTVISRYKDFKTAWVQYQMVAYVKNREIGRTQIFLNNITIAPCH